MTGRHVTLEQRPTTRPRGRRRLLSLLFGGVLLFAAGVVIGSTLGGDDTRQASTSTITHATPTTTSANASDQPADSARPSPRTRDGAAAAAATSITAFDLSVVLDEALLRETVNRIAARDFRAALLETYRQGTPMLRERLGIGGTPEPVYFVRTTPVGYRIERYSDNEATVAVWTVGVTGSGATVQPQQSWDTQRVTLIWEDAAWKVTGFSSDPGPTPPLARAEAADSPTVLFTAIPGFDSYRHAIP